MPGASLSHFPGASPQCIWSILGVALDESKPKICYLSLHPSGICRGELVTTFLTMKPQPKRRNVSLGTPCKRRPSRLLFDVRSFPLQIHKIPEVDSVAINGLFVAGDDSVHTWCTARGGCW